MQMLTHRAPRIPLHHQVDVSLLVFVAGRRIWPNCRLLHLWAFVLRQQSRRDLQARHIVGVGEGEAELFRVVVYFFDRVEFEVDEALVATCEGFSWHERCFWRNVLLLSWGRGGVRLCFASAWPVVGIVEVATPEASSAKERVDKGIRATGWWSGCITAACCLNVEDLRLVMTSCECSVCSELKRVKMEQMEFTNLLQRLSRSESLSGKHGLEL